MALAVAACAALFLSGDRLSRAQPLSMSSASVEWRAAHAALIVRAVIEDVAVHHPGDPFHRYQTVTVRVLETIKGAPADRLSFVHNGDFGPFRLADLQRDRQELLLFLDCWMRSGRFSRATGGYAYARFPYVVEHAAILTAEDVRFAETSVPPLSAALARLSTPAQLIEVIKTYLKDRCGGEPPRGVIMELPPHLRGGFYQVRFTFPADARPDDPLPAVERPIVDFATFKERFAREPPAEKEPPYTRDKSGYIGVYALELMAADCDAIVRGVIEDWCFVAATEDPTGPSCGAEIRVLETFKGEAPERILVYVTDARDLEWLRRSQKELVIFLRSRSLSGPAAALGYQTRAGLWDDAVIVLDRGQAEVLFADLTWSREPEEILARLRAVTERERAQGATSAGACRGLPVFDVHPPASIAAGSSIAGNPYSVVYLPVDRELEANAREWATAENPDLRWLAARAMVYFKSDKNAKLLEGMLNDEATWERRHMLHMTRLAYPHRPEYLVRWEAWHVLDGWGYEAPKPSFRVSP